MYRFIISAITVLLFAGCAPVISSEYLQKASEIGFDQVRDNPEANINSILILGGTIARTENTAGGTEIEVVQHPVSHYGDIIDRDVTQGRFLLQTSKQLDPLIFRRGRLMTIAGELIGTRTRPLHGKEYRYPLLEAREIHLWKRHRQLPTPYIYSPAYYPPYYYEYQRYWYDPYYRGPLLTPAP
jgi:outer membrane lipoprotein